MTGVSLFVVSAVFLLLLFLLLLLVHDSQSRRAVPLVVALVQVFVVVIHGSVSVPVTLCPHRMP